MNKVSKTFAKTFILALAIMFGALVIGCKGTTEPAGNQQYDSEAAADLHATALGTESGGAGVNFADVKSLTEAGTISGTAFDPKSPYYDPKSKPDNPAWMGVDVKYVRKFKRVLSLEELKTEARLEGFRLLQRGNRLSVMPVSEEHWNVVLELE